MLERADRAVSKSLLFRHHYYIILSLLTLWAPKSNCSLKCSQILERLSRLGGRHLELPPISAEDYHEYIHTKFKSFGLSMSLDLIKFLLNEMQHIPEAINIVCDKMTKMQTMKSPIDKNLIVQVIHLAVDGLSPRKRGDDLPT